MNWPMCEICGGLMDIQDMDFESAVGWSSQRARIIRQERSAGEKFEGNSGCIEGYKLARGSTKRGDFLRVVRGSMNRISFGESGGRD